MVRFAAPTLTDWGRAAHIVMGALTYWIFMSHGDSRPSWFWWPLVGGISLGIRRILIVQGTHFDGGIRGTSVGLISWKEAHCDISCTAERLSIRTNPGRFVSAFALIVMITLAGVMIFREGSLSEAAHRSITKLALWVILSSGLQLIFWAAWLGGPNENITLGDGKLVIHSEFTRIGLTLPTRTFDLDKVRGFRVAGYYSPILFEPDRDLGVTYSFGENLDMNDAARVVSAIESWQMSDVSQQSLS